MVSRQQPLSVQVRVQLMRWIQAHRPPQSDGALPSESEMAEMFDTSRATIREALAQLERERIIIRRHGSGTYLNPSLHKLTYAFTELLDPLHFIEQYGYPAAIRSWESQLAPVGEAAAAALEISAAARALHLRALYLAEDNPAIWLTAVIPVDALRPDDLPIPRLTFLAVFAAEVSGIKPAYSLANISAISAGAEASEQLCVPPGAALLALEELYLTEYGKPVFNCRSALAPWLQLNLLRNTPSAGEHVSIW